MRSLYVTLKADTDYTVQREGKRVILKVFKNQVGYN
jgi:hypothetical protein